MASYLKMTRRNICEKGELPKSWPMYKSNTKFLVNKKLNRASNHYCTLKLETPQDKTT